MHRDSEITQLNPFPLQTAGPHHPCSKARAATGDFAKPRVALPMVAMQSLNVPKTVTEKCQTQYPSYDWLEVLTPLLLLRSCLRPLLLSQ